VEKDAGSLYFFTKDDPSGTRAGAMVFTLDDVGAAFVKHVSGESLAPVLEVAMLWITPVAVSFTFNDVIC
jgi:hypothetical protein